MSTRTAKRAGMIAAALSIALAGPAGAQPARDPAAADEAFRAAVAAKLAGDVETACAKFEASMLLDPSPSTLLNIAECLEQKGKLARAWSETQRARVLNAETPGEQRRKELDLYATTTAERLRAKLAWIRVTLRGAPADLVVQRDGVTLPAAVLDQPIPADPGGSTVTAAAPGHAPFRIELRLAEGKTTEVTIALRPAPVPPSDTARIPKPEAPRPLWPWITGGAGLALAGAGIGFAIAQAGTQADIDTSCHQQPDGRCRAGYAYEAQNERLYRDFGLSLGFGIAGGIAAAAGVLGLILRPGRPDSAGGSRLGTSGLTVLVAPRLGPQVAGLSVAGELQ
jgi:hypothetical protein